MLRSMQPMNRHWMSCLGYCEQVNGQNYFRVLRLTAAADPPELTSLHSLAPTEKSSKVAHKIRLTQMYTCVYYRPSKPLRPAVRSLTIRTLARIRGSPPAPRLCVRSSPHLCAKNSLPESHQSLNPGHEKPMFSGLAAQTLRLSF
jgi:hypothetical protein